MTGIQIVETGETFETASECAKHLKRSAAAVSSCLNGINSTCAGYHLKLVDLNDSYNYSELFDEKTVKIDNAPGYFVSESGVVYGPGSLGHRGIHKMSPQASDKYGHQIVDIYINGKRKHNYVAALVAEAFIPNPNNYPEVCHKDGNPHNNHVSNLKWGTHKENMKDARLHGTFHDFTEEEQKMGSEALRTPVKAINLNTSEETIFESQAEAARVLGLHQPNIRHVLSGRYRKTGGFKFEYIEKESEDGKRY